MTPATLAEASRYGGATASKRGLCAWIFDFKPEPPPFLIFSMSTITPDLRSQIEEITRRAGHVWRYL